MSGFSMGFGLAAVDMATIWRPKFGLTILLSFDNISVILNSAKLPKTMRTPGKSTPDSSQKQVLRSNKD